ncbi:MAG: amidase [Planctomycetota bacterium]
MNRRNLLKSIAALGIGSLAFQRSLAAQAAEQQQITPEMIAQAQWVAGIELTDEERKTMLRNLRGNLVNANRLREVEVDYNVPPCLHFQPSLPRSADASDRRDDGATAGEVVNDRFAGRNRIRIDDAGSTIKRPASDEALAFLSVGQLSHLIRSSQVTSQELTRLYLKRLRRYDPMLNCVVTLTEELAMRQASKADKEIGEGNYRGPLHGIPWGAKDLIAVPGYPTTWGATPYADQQFQHTATIAQRLEDAGAVLVAKLSMGALAMGDQWMEKRTRNPWDPRRGSSGSSAGSASAVSAGLVGFAIGTETLGSILTPSRICGTSSLRPTFGRVPRFGLMPLAWSFDKAGPMCRDIEDCALVLDAIHGSDGRDPTAVDRPFAWPPRSPLDQLRVGYIESPSRLTDDQRRQLQDFGVTLVPITLPDDIPVYPLPTSTKAEASTMFQGFARQHVTEGLNTWPDTFRAGQFITAVDYLNATRVRTLLIQRMDELFSRVDVMVNSGDIVHTNLTGHPSVTMPSGFTRRGGARLPRSITMTGRLYDEARLLALASAWQQKTGHHLQHPSLEMPGTEEPSELNEEKQP